MCLKTKDLIAIILMVAFMRYTWTQSHAISWVNLWMPDDQAWLFIFSLRKTFFFFTCFSNRILKEHN